MSRATVAAALDLDADALARLDAYAALLVKWQARVNLVGPSTVPELWDRHLFDCGQLQRWVPSGTRSLVDMGAGAGLPGLVLAILGVPGVTLVEADKRKAAFLREAARAVGAPVDVRAERLEAMAKTPADVVTARALAPLPRLLDWAQGFVGPATTCLFLKGVDADRELTDAARSWRMKVERRPSLSDGRGVVLELTDVRAIGRE